MNYKNRLYFFVALFFLSSIIVLFIYQKNKENSADVKNFTRLSVSDTASVNKIFIASLDGRNYTFKRQANGFWVFGPNYIADPVKIKSMLATLHDIEIKRPVTKAEYQNLINDLSAEHLKIEVYVNNQLLKTLFLGDAVDEGYGTTVLLDGDEKPVIAHVRGFPGFLKPTFDVQNPLQWRWRRIFNSTPKQLQSVSVQWHGEPNQSFIAYNSNNSFFIKDMPIADSVKLKEYILGFNKGSLEQFLDLENPTMQQMRDSLISGKASPIVTITVDATDSLWSNSITLYEYNFDDFLPRYIALLGNKKEFVTVQKQNFDKFLIKRSYFTPKP